MKKIKVKYRRDIHEVLDELDSRALELSKATLLAYSKVQLDDEIQVIDDIATKAMDIVRTIAEYKLDA